MAKSDWCVGKTMTRVILFRVLPGKEYAVGLRIAELCHTAGIKKQNFQIYRLFGSYDLVFIQDHCSLLNSDFVRLGTIPFITGANEYICYKWRPISGRSHYHTFDIAKLKKPVAALCFLKINPALIQQDGIMPEKVFANFLKERGGGIQVLNTLGWGDAILLVSEESLDGVFDSIRRFFGLEYGLPQQRNNRRDYFVEKTLTLIGCALNVSNFHTNSSPHSLPITQQLKERLKVRFSLACRPRAMQSLLKSANKILGVNETDSAVRFGPRDLQFELSLDKVNSLNDLVGKLDQFRDENFGRLIRTHTDVQDRQLSAQKRISKIINRRTPLISLKPEEASSLASLGSEGSAVATAIYRYNNLIQNDLLFDAFSDLLRSVKVLRDEALMPNQQNIQKDDLRRLLAGRLYQLELALNQRAQDVYLGLEESPFGAYPSGMGIQKVFKGLEAFVGLILRRQQEDWAGFVRLSHLSERFEHYGDVVIVPPDSVLKAGAHWTLTHEIMHVLQNLRPSLDIRKFQTQPNSRPVHVSDRYGHILLESMVEVMDYALCCPFDFKKYIQTVWSYLREEALHQHESLQYEAYLYRAFAVACYAEFGSAGDWNPKSNYTEMERLLKNCVQTIQSVCPLSFLNQIDERGQRPIDIIIARFMNELVFYMPSIFACVAKLRQRKKGPRLNVEKDIKQKVAKLMKGMILSLPEIQNPDVLAWTLKAHNNLEQNDRLHLAWILSLWHAYHQLQLGPDVLKLSALRPNSSL